MRTTPSPTLGVAFDWLSVNVVGTVGFGGGGTGVAAHGASVLILYFALITESNWFHGAWNGFIIVSLIPDHNRISDMTIRRFVIAAILMGLSTVAWASDLSPQPNQWEADVKAFEELDKQNPPAPGAVLFVGSASIQGWNSLAKDFPDLKVIQRGFRGSELSDIVFFTDRIVLPYNPRTIVLYAGDNDINAGKTPEQVYSAFVQFVDQVRQKLPRTRIAFISIKPSPSRMKYIEQIRKANLLINGYCVTTKGLTFIDTFTPMLGPDGNPKKELFLDDDMHLSEAGYKLWAPIVRRYVK